MTRANREGEYRELWLTLEPTYAAFLRGLWDTGEHEGLLEQAARLFGGGSAVRVDSFRPVFSTPSVGGVDLGVCWVVFLEVPLDGGELDEFLGALRRQSGTILSAGVAPTPVLDSIPNDPYYGPDPTSYTDIPYYTGLYDDYDNEIVPLTRVYDQWGLPAMGLPLLWRLTRGAGQVIGIADTGVWHEHEDLAGRMLRNTADVVLGDVGVDLTLDSNTHGTKCAGIAAAHGNNHLGICGVAHEASIVAGRIADDSASSFLEAMVSCAANGAGVVNCSWHLSLGEDLVGAHDVYTAFVALAAVAATGAVVVCSSAEEGDDSVFPLLDGWMIQAAFPSVLPPPWPYPPLHPPGIASVIGTWSGELVILSVAALDSADELLAGSAFGPWLSVCAPGQNCSTTHFFQGAAGLISAYDNMSGSSAAAPHVSGLVAMLRALHPQATRQWLRDVVLEQAEGIVVQVAGAPADHRKANAPRPGVLAWVEGLVATSSMPTADNERYRGAAREMVRWSGNTLNWITWFLRATPALVRVYDRLGRPMLNDVNGPLRSVADMIRTPVAPGDPSPSMMAEAQAILTIGNQILANTSLLPRTERLLIERMVGRLVALLGDLVGTAGTLDDFRGLLQVQRP